MKETEILEIVKELINPYIDKKDRLDNLNFESDLITDFEINSAYIVEIILDVEEKFDIDIEDDLLERMENVGNIINIIKDKISAKC